MISLETAAQMLLRRRMALPGPVIYHPMTSVIDTLPTGQAVTMSGSGYTATTIDGIDCISFPTNANNWFSIPYSRNIYSQKQYSVSFWLKKDCPAEGTGVRMFSFGRGLSDTALYRLKWYIGKRSADEDKTLVAFWNRSLLSNCVLLQNSDSSWHHVAINGTIDVSSSYKKMAINIFLDGTKYDTLETNYSQGNAQWDKIEFGAHSGSESGYVAYSALRVWDRQLSQAEIVELSLEFTPVTT